MEGEQDDGVVPPFARHLRMPEYEAPAIDLYRETVLVFMKTQNPLFAQIRQSSVPSAARPDPERTAGLMQGYVGAPMEMPITGSITNIDTAAVNVEAWIESAWNGAREALSVLMPQFYQNLTAAARSVDNEISASGALSWDHWIDMLDKMELDFDENGKHKNLALVIHPDNMKNIEILMDTAKTEEQERRYHEIIERKRSEFLSRKRRRRLD